MLRTVPGEGDGCRWCRENNDPGERRKDSAAQVQGRGGELGWVGSRE